MSRRKRQGLRRVRNDIVALERRCERLMRALSDAEHAFRRAWANERQIEDQNGRLIEMLGKASAMQPPPPIIIELPDDAPTSPYGGGRVAMPCTPFDGPDGDRCAVGVEPDKDHCPAHARLAAKGENR
jgi:hypothetical protein